MNTSGLNLTVMMVFAGGGILLGALLTFLIMQAVYSKRETQEPVQSPPMESPPEPVEPEINPDEKIKVMSFWRTAVSGELQANMDDQWLAQGAAMNHGQRARFERALQEASGWLGLHLVKDIPAQATPAAMPTAVPLQKQEVVQVILDAPKRRLSIVEQVDEILQDLLEKKQMKDRNIRLTEMPNKGVIVWVGKEYFVGIDAVPDDEVKQLIRTAVKRWEETATS
jgi:hypothetical protein